MTDFLNNLTAAQATIISSIISAIIALSVILINRYFESNKIKREKYDTLKKYANPIIFAAEQLAWRLKEILEFNGAYLLPNAPMNGFFRYKFNSTVYRLCAILGWIQAAKKEQSYLEGLKLKHHKKVQEAFNRFQKNLADGSHVEVSILDELIRLFNLKPISLTYNEKVLIGVELEKTVFTYIPDSIKKNTSLLEENKQIDMLEEILNYICRKTYQTNIKLEIIKEKRASAINEISREFCWIYRDWQSAIGDVMLKEIQGANRRYDVLGFAEFQCIHESNEWLKKVDGLFSSLDVSVDDRFDTRVQQLKQVFGSTVEIINVLRTLISEQETIPDKSFQALNTFNNKINDIPTQEPRRKLIIKYS
jgi:hypothetical protein